MPTFENCVVTIDGNEVFAQNASISVQNSRSAVKGFGSQGSVGSLASRVKGSLGVSYLLGGDDPIRALAGLSEDTVVSASIGPFQCFGAVLTSYSLSVEPNSPVTCEVKMDFYGDDDNPPYNQGGSTSTMDPTDEFLHGGATTVSSDLLWSDSVIGCTYSINQSIRPIYLLGQFTPHTYYRDNGTISVTLKGPGLGAVVTSPCEGGRAAGTIELKGLCSDISDSIDYEGYVVNPSINISPNQEIIGSLEVFSTF